MTVATEEVVSLETTSLRMPDRRKRASAYTTVTIITDRRGFSI